MHTLADKRTQWPTLFREWFCNSEANRHEICTRLRQRVRNKVSRISSESVKSHSMKLTMMFKLDFKKMTLTAFRTPVQNGLMREVNIFCTENEHLHAFYAPNKKSCKLDKGIMLIFVSEINRPLLLAKGVCYNGTVLCFTTQGVTYIFFHIRLLWNPLAFILCPVENFKSSCVTLLCDEQRCGHISFYA